jgi:plastocyanin
MLTKAVPVLLFAGAAAFLSSSTIREAGANSAKKVPVVTVHAKEFSFAAPTTIEAGPTIFKLVNDGQQLHHVTVVKLEQGKTIADLEAALKSNGPPPDWMVAVGGPNAAVPGASSEATLNLDAGNYALLCYVPSPGETMPHAAKGMVAALTVVKATGVAQAGATYEEARTPDIHLELKDYGFTLSKPITAGTHTIHVMNDGPQEHEAVLARLAPGKSAADVVAWVEGGMQGPPPGRPVGGMSDLSKGRTAMFTTDFTPGHYALICFVPAPDGKVHAAHGMTMDFEVK